jgi:hypothetical protein
MVKSAKNEIPEESAVPGAQKEPAKSGPKPGSKPESEKFKPVRVTIRVGPRKRTMEQLVAACNFGWFNRLILGDDFKHSLPLSLPAHAECELEIILVESAKSVLDSNQSSDFELAERIRNVHHLDRPTVDHVLLLAEQHHDLVMKYEQIIFPHKPWDPSGRKQLAVLMLTGDPRRSGAPLNLALHWIQRSQAPLFAVVGVVRKEEEQQQPVAPSQPEQKK